MSPLRSTHVKQRGGAPLGGGSLGRGSLRAGPLGERLLDPALRVPAALATLAALAAVGLGAASGTLISRAALRPEVFLSLGLTVTLVRALGLGRAALRYAERLTSHAAALRLGTGLRLALFEQVSRFGRDLSATERSGDMLARAAGDLDARQMHLLRVKLPLTALGVTWALLSAWLGWLDPLLGALVSLPLLLAALGSWQLRGRAEALARRRAHLTREHASQLLDALAGAADGAGRLSGPRLERLSAQLEDVAHAEGRWSAGLTLWREGLFALSLGGVLWRGAALLAAGTLPGPTLAAAALATAAAFELAAGLAAVPTAHAEWQEAEERSSQLTTLRPQVRSPAQPLPLPTAPLEFTLEEAGVQRGGRTIFSGVNLCLRAGERTALTGPSGSGKTTLAALLTRDLDPSVGRASLGGANLRQLALTDVRAQVSWHEQRAPLLDGTIAENLQLGGHGVSEKRLRDLLDRLDLAHLPLDLWVGEGGGTRLSGGERARISIARALLKSSALLIFDEPTAHLDPETEARTLEVIAQELRGRTLLVLTHRPAPLALADRVYHLADGSLNEIPCVG